MRAALEQRDRDAAELRAALRKALEIVPRQLPIGNLEENARQATTPPTRGVTDGGATGDAATQAPQKVTEEATHKEPRKVVLGLR